MKSFIPWLLLIPFASGCYKNPAQQGFKKINQLVIALQPLSGYSKNAEELYYLRHEIEKKFNTTVIINDPIDIPEHFTNYTGMDIAYSADSLITLLSKRCNDSVDIVVGITNHPLYIVGDATANPKRLNDAPGKPPTHFKPVLGFSYVNGNAAVISDYRLQTPEKNLLFSRIKKLAFHELGHNLGLPRCSSDSCLMSEQNGAILYLDKSNEFYCGRCATRLR